MANTLSNAGIVDGQIIYAVQVNQIIDALTSADDYDVSVSGSLNVTGSISWSGSSDAAGAGVQFVVRDTSSGELYTTGSSAFDFKLSGSFPAERLVITGLTSSANPGGLVTNNNLRTYNNNNGIAIGGSEGNNGVNGLGFIISENPSNGNHAILSDGSGSNLNIRAAGGDAGNSYVVILADQPGIDITDVFTIAKFGGPLRSTELYHTGSLVFYTNKINGTGSVYITGSLSGSGDVYFPRIPNTVTPHIVGFDTASGKFTYYNTSSFGGAVFNTSSLMVTGSVLSNVLTFTKGDGSTFSLTVNTGSAASVNTGSFYYSSSVHLNTITFFQGDGTTESVTVNTGSGGTVNTGSLMITGSVLSNVLTFTKGNGSTFSLTVDTGSAASINTGSFYVSSSVSNATITFTQGDGSTEQVIVNNVSSASYALTSSHTPEALVTASLAGSNLIFTKGNNSQFTLVLPGGGGGNPITGSYTGSVLTTNIQSIDFTGAGVVATVGGSNDITVNIPGGGSTDTGSLMITGSVSDATLTFTKGNGSTFPLTINNVNNAVSASCASTASYVLNAVSASFAPNIYNSDGAVSGNRLVSVGANTLTFRANLTGGTFKVDSSATGDVIITGLPTGISSSLLAVNPATGKVIYMATSSIQNVVSASNAISSSYAISASFAPNIYNSNGTLTGNREVNLSNYDLKFNNTGAKFIISGSDRVVFNNLSQGNNGYILTYDLLGDLGTQGIVNYISTSSLSVASASYAPNLYNSNGVLTGTRTVDLNGENLTFIANGGESFRISSSIGSDVTITDLTQASQSMVIGYNFSNGQLTAMNTSSFGGGGTVNTGSLLVTGSVSNATLTFTKGNGNTFPLTVNNVANATTAGSVNSDSVYAEAGTDFDVWVTAGNTFTLLNIDGTSIEAVAPKSAESAGRILAIATMEVYRGSSGPDFTAFQYRLFNSTQVVAISGSTRTFSSYLQGSGEASMPTTFTFTVPISSDVTSGDTIELQVRQSPLANLASYSSASISYGDLALVNITN